VLRPLEPLHDFILSLSKVNFAMPKRIFLKIELTPAEDDLLKRKYRRGIAARLAKRILLDLEFESPRNNAAVQSRRELIAHLARVGSNVNQLSKVMNTAALEGRITEKTAVKLQAILLDISSQLESYAPAHAH
jgi:hypothetical protein